MASLLGAGVPRVALEWVFAGRSERVKPLLRFRGKIPHLEYALLWLRASPGGSHRAAVEQILGARHCQMGSLAGAARL